MRARRSPHLPSFLRAPRGSVNECCHTSTSCCCISSCDAPVSPSRQPQRPQRQEQPHDEASLLTGRRTISANQRQHTVASASPRGRRATAAVPRICSVLLLLVLQYSVLSCQAWQSSVPSETIALSLKQTLQSRNAAMSMLQVSASSTRTDTTHMFIPSPTLTSAALASASARYPHSPVYRWKQQQQDGPVATASASGHSTNNMNNLQPPRQRGTLGIVLQAEPTSGRPFSNVDASAWNGAPAWDVPTHGDDAVANSNKLWTDKENKNRAKSFLPSSVKSRPNRLIWSNFAQPYQVIDRVQKERPELNLEEWQAELLQQDSSTNSRSPPPTSKSKGETKQADNELLQSSSDQAPSSPSAPSRNVPPPSSSTFNSLAEWVRTVDLEPLLQRREEIHRQKQHGKKRPKRQVDPAKNAATTVSSREDLVRSLTKLFDTSSKTKYSNYQVKQMYAAAKLADQQGQPAVAQQILEQLIEATPSDGRLYRRLARLHKEQGDWSRARATLQKGLRIEPQNAFLWHGLGTLAANDEDAKRCYRQAIRCDPYMPHAFHALGTLQHLQGRIANAMQTLHKGISHCPTNHRLHHALGDLYRDAKMLPMAEKSYRKALRLGPEISHGFAYHALACVAYDRGDVEEARTWLTKAVKLNHGRHVNAWKSLASLEEAQGNTEQARRICQQGLDKYEKGLLRYYRRQRKPVSSLVSEPNEDAVAAKNELLRNIPEYRPGDRFFQLYRTWTRLEERYGSTDSTEQVYARANAAFPHNAQLLMDQADWYARLRLPDKARSIFASVCQTTDAALPFRHFAEYEMSQNQYETARKILFRGALMLSHAGSGSHDQQGLAELYHTWAVVEWYLDEVGRAEVLLDHALRLTPAGAEGAVLRSTLLYTLGRLQFYKGEPLLAQHCVALCFKENVDATAPLWDLWAAVASTMANESLEMECRLQAREARSTETIDEVSSLLKKSKDQSATSLQDKMRREPWDLDAASAHHKSESAFAYGVRLPVLQSATQMPLAV